MLFRSYVSLAHALWRTGDRVGANQMLADVASALPKQIAHNSPGLQLAWGQLLLEMSDPAHALSQFQLALPQFKEQFAQNPNGLLPRRQLLDIYEALAQGYAAHARLSNTPPEQKLADWQAARASYQQSLDLLKDWPRWADSTIYNSRRAAVTQALAQCDTAIAQLGRR